MAEDHTNAIAVRTAVSRLPDRQRLALVLRYFADLSVYDVARMLRCPEGTVKTLTRTAILALRREGLTATAPEIEEQVDDVT